MPRASVDTVAFTKVNIIPLDEEHVLENQIVILVEGRVVELGPSSDIGAPSGAFVIYGKNCYLILGLAEMHFHLSGPDADQDYVDRILYLFPLRLRVCTGEQIPAWNWPVCAL